MIVATGVLWCLTTAIGMERFMDWGWRVPFLLSVLLIVVGTFIRRAVEESPVFLEMQARKRAASAAAGPTAAQASARGIADRADLRGQQRRRLSAGGLLHQLRQPRG